MAEIVIKCYKDILKIGDEESFENLCKLLTSCGEMLDKSNSSDLDVIFAQMTVDEAGKSNRVKHMFRETLELRANSWIPKIRRSDSQKATKEIECCTLKKQTINVEKDTTGVQYKSTELVPPKTIHTTVKTIEDYSGMRDFTKTSAEKHHIPSSNKSSNTEDTALKKNLPNEIETRDQICLQNTQDQPNVLTGDNSKQAILSHNEFCKVLNKLTLQNFDTFLAQVRNLDIDNLEHLQNMVKLIFEKAVNQPELRNVCSALYGAIEFALTNNKRLDEVVNFRKFLTAKCLVELVKIKTVSEKLEKLSSNLKDDEKEKLEIKLAERKMELKKKSCAATKFIGELFKKHLLSTAFTINCLKQLLQATDDISRECLCTLLTDIGKTLDRTVNLNAVFATIKNIFDEGSPATSNEILFLLQQIMELRQNHWIPKGKSNPNIVLDKIEKKSYY